MTQISEHAGRAPSEHTPGSQPAHFIQSGGDEIHPGRQPDELVPGKGDDYRPDRTPDEVAPDQGDFDRPDRSSGGEPTAAGFGSAGNSGFARLTRGLILVRRRG